ncbi:MAG TPA: hypothetical protein VF407_14990, partial [Polyangiaceae bacterium]
MTPRKRFQRRLSLFALAALVGTGAWAAGCGSTDDGATFPNGSDDGGGILLDGQSFGDSGGGFNTDGGGDGAVSALVISPANPTIDVTITNGAISVAPVDFVAKTTSGAEVAASWSIDRGELGKLVTATGEFTANGNVAGTGVVSAKSGATIATTNVTVKIHSIQVGNDYGDGGVPEAGVGGVGGVGGEGLGGAVDSTTQTNLATTGTAPTTPTQLGFLYPYDKTVFPRGLLAPLLQWESNVSGIQAVYVHLTEKNFEFEGFYSVSGASRFHQPIDQDAWAKATNSNSGDLLHLDVKIQGAAGVVGPISRDFLIAPGILTGTIYYQTYASQVAGTAGTLAIRPGKTDPTLAIPGTKNQCVVCHEVSGDGSTLISEDSSYANATSYDLTDGGAKIQYYSGSAGDGTS